MSQLVCPTISRSAISARYSKMNADTDILKVNFVAQSKLYFSQLCERKCTKLPEKSHKVVTGKLVKMHDFSSLGVHIQDFAQTQLNSAQSHDCMTATFRNSG